MRILMLNMLLLAATVCAATPDAIALPAPEQLMAMSLKERLDFYQGLFNLPPAERDTALTALRTEIQGMTPAQKQQMQDRFQTEFASLPPAQQDQVKQQLQAMGR
jgi:hypothetical protein